MRFCPKCGMMIIKYLKKDGRSFGICLKGHETLFDSQKIDTEREIEKKNISRNKSRNEIVIIDKDTKLRSQTITSIACPYCGAKRSILVSSFVLYGDEDQVNMMKCLNCGKNFRVGTGVSGQ